MLLPFALLAVPSALSGLGSVFGAGSLVGAISIGKLSTGFTVGSTGLLAAGSTIGSGKLVFPALAVLVGGAALCTDDRRIRACLGSIAALLVAGPIAGLAGATGVLGSASTGAAISTLKGAALWNAALAKLGGGTIASGGGGVVWGTANVSAAGAASGWATGK